MIVRGCNPALKQFTAKGIQAPDKSTNSLLSLILTECSRVEEAFMRYMKYLTGNILPIIKYYAQRNLNAV